MNAALAMHTAARQYCRERHAYWCDQYANLTRTLRDRETDGSHYTPAALATFPRYNVLGAICVELERIDPAKLADLDNTRALLVQAGKTANDAFTQKPICKIDAKAIAEEREAFCRFVEGLNLTALSSVQELPYRRVLTDEESTSIWSRLRARWRISNEYWYPLRECELSDVLAFKTSAFDEAMFARLRDMLAARGVEHVWELREYGPEYEQDVSLFVPCYNGAEGYWSSGDLEWIVYASHESSVTIAGWVLEELKAQWPLWQHYIWTDPFS